MYPPLKEAILHMPKKKSLAAEGRVWLILQGRTFLDFLFEMDFEDQIGPEGRVAFSCL